MTEWKKVIRYNYLLVRIARRFIKVQFWLGFKKEALENFANLSGFCGNNYIGTYRWVKLENDIIQISKKYLPPSTTELIDPKKTVQNVLHVLSEAYEVGGHTQLIAMWIAADSTRTHTILLTNQKKELPEKLKNLSVVYGTKIVQLSKSDDYLARANELRSISLNSDVVILSHHSHDPIPLLAFAYSGGPSVAVLNHADHIFWIGAAIADVVIQIRELYERIDSERRQIRSSLTLPILISGGNPVESSNTVRAELGVRDDQVMLLTIASEYKFKPSAEYNYFTSIIQVLEECPSAISCIVGVSPDSQLGETYKHDRLKYLGVISNTANLEMACDIYVESFPFVSYTSLLQTVAKGKASQLIYDPLIISKCFDNDAFPYPEGRDEWKKNLVKLIKEKNFRDRSAEQQASFVINNHFKVDTWKLRLEKCYSATISQPHVVRELQHSKWITTANEGYLLETMSNKINLAGIVYSSNIIFKFFVLASSRILLLLKKLY